MQERHAARVVLLNGEQKILLLQCTSSNFPKPYWITPGGGIDTGETPYKAATRELFEETGICNAKILKEPSWYSESILLYKNEPTLFKEHFFLGSIEKAHISSLNFTEEEKSFIQGIVWWDLHTFIAQGETLFPHGLISHLDTVIYQRQMPVGTTNVSRCIS